MFLGDNLLIMEQEILPCAGTSSPSLGSRPIKHKLDFQHVGGSYGSFN